MKEVVGVKLDVYSSATTYTAVETSASETFELKSFAFWEDDVWGIVRVTCCTAVCMLDCQSFAEISDSWQLPFTPGQTFFCKAEH